MVKSLGFTAFSAVLGAVLATGCKPHTSSASATRSGYIQAPYQDESQYIVETICSDLAEQMYYASSHRLPDARTYQVTAVEKAGSPQDAPIYELRIRLNSKLGPIESEVNVNGPIWSPAVYAGLARQLGAAVGLSVTNAGTWRDTSLLSKLTDGSPETIERENEELSGDLEKDFTDPQLHEKAAALLGAFLLRDHSGNFSDIRAPLSRMTAHLAMAQFLNGTNSYGINGQMAEAMLFTLMNDEKLALDQLNAIGTNDDAVAPMVRALWTRNTGDYRLLGSMNNLTQVEGIEWFYAMANNVSAPLAWPKLSDEQQRTIDYVRIADQEGYSVDMGHDLLAAALPLELGEIQAIYEMTHHKALGDHELVAALNVMPERCFTSTADGSVHVSIIGWGQWANFLQRHLCHAIQSNFNFLQNCWGVPDDAKEFAAKCDEDLAGLRLYPFVERFDATDVNGYHKSVDDGLKVTAATPQLTPVECWNHLFYTVDFAPSYCPNIDLPISEWFRHSPPPGTAYDFSARLDQTCFSGRSDICAVLEKLHQWAPNDCDITYYCLTHKFGEHFNYEEATNFFGGLLAYNLNAMTEAAESVRNDPPRYESIMLKAAELSPALYFTLGDFELNQHENDKAAEYYDKGAASDPDSVCVANYATWRVRYYLKKGDVFKARAIADFAGEVYSYKGLYAEGVYFESTSNYPEAFNWYQKIEDRYGDSGPLIGFCKYYKGLTGDSQFDSELQKRLAKVFPKGNEKASLSDFRGAPHDGVLIEGQNDTLQSYGLGEGDVIVALNGTRTHTFYQYDCVRALLNTPNMDLIVWQGSAYHVVKASPPNHRFGVEFGDYNPN